MMRGLVLTVMLLAVGVSRLRGQVDVNQCQQSPGKTRCNIGLCFQTTANAVNKDTNANIAKALLRGAYSVDSPCEGNFGCAFYRQSIRPVDVCEMWPRQTTRNSKHACVGRVLAAQSDAPSTGNHLEVCLGRLNNDNAFFRVTHFGSCRSTAGVISDRDLANPAQALAQAANLKAKGVFIVCFLVGNTQVAYNPAYSVICDDLYEASDFPDLWRGVEEMYAKLKCCDDPPPPPTTTTTTTTTTTSQPGECDGCRIVNSVGYLADKSRCDCWKRCVFGENNQILVTTSCCQCGMFWDQGLLTCMSSADIDCPIDPCKESGVNAYAYPGNCRAYWTCDGSRSIDAQCCPSGQAFNSGSQQCENSNTCADPCPCDLQTTTQVCPFQPNPLNVHTYFVPEHADAPPTLMTCPPGTDYNETLCKCSIFIDVVVPPCPADFDLRCTEDPLIDHANNAFIANFGVTLTDPPDGVCTFGGNDRLMAPRYSNYDWRDSFAIYSNFNGESNPNNNAPLMSNTDCDEPASVELRLVRGAGNAPLIEAFIRTNEGTYTTRVPYREAQQNEAYMYYDGENLRLCVKYADGNVDSSIFPAEGLVPRCQCAVQIGYGWQNRYFTGQIFDTRIYINCIPDNFCP